MTARVWPLPLLAGQLLVVVGILAGSDPALWTAVGLIAVAMLVASAAPGKRAER